MKRIICCILNFILIASIFTGCDYKDIDRRMFIMAIGIDGDPLNPDFMKISVKAAMPGSIGESSGGGTPQKSSTDIYTLSGNSLSNILRTLKSETSMEPDFSQMKVIVFGEKYVEQHDIVEIEGFFIRRRDFQEMAWITLGVPSALDVLSVTPKEEKVPGNSLFMKFGQGSESPYAYKKRSHEFYSDVITPGCTPACPIIEIKDGKIVMNKAALFTKGKVTLVLSKEETQLLNLLYEKVTLGSITIDQSDKSVPLTISIDSGKSKIKIGKAKNKEDIVCTIDIKIEASLEETGGFSGELQSLAPEFEKVLRKQVMNLLNKFKENNVDPLRLEMRYWSNTRDFMPTEAWLTDILPNIKFEVNPKIKIIHGGILSA